MEKNDVAKFDRKYILIWQIWQIWPCIFHKKCWCNMQTKYLISM